VGIQGAWLNWHLAQIGQPLTGDLSAAEARQVKKRWQQVAPDFQDMVLVIRQEGEVKVAYTLQGHRFGNLMGERAEQFTDGQQVQIKHALAHGGNLRVIFHRPSETFATEEENG
jgi:hypothetical protein